VYAEALAYAIRTGADAEQIHRFAPEVAERARSPKSVTEALVNAASKPPADFSRQMGWVLIALQNAFWQLLHAERVEQGIVSTVMSGDTDTNAERGHSRHPSRRGLRVERYPAALAGSNINLQAHFGDRGRQAPRPEAFWPVDALWIAERLLRVGRNQQTS
jgi:hypothetical protein